MIRGPAAFVTASVLATAALSGQSIVSVALLLGSEEHRVDAGFGVVHSSGFVPGGAVEARLGPHWSVAVAARSGNLRASSGPADDEDIAEVSSAVRAAPTGWLAFELNARARSVTTALARQHWTTLGAAVDLRMPLIGSATEGFLRFGVPLLVRASGLAAPTVAAEGGAGVRYRLGPVTGQLSYDLRRFDFAPVSGRGRLEQISTLTFGVAVAAVRLP